MMAKIQIPDSIETDFELGEPEKTRRRRELDSPSALPTSLPTPGAKQPSLDQNPSGPYTWPIYSGKNTGLNFLKFLINVCLFVLFNHG